MALSEPLYFAFLFAIATVYYILPSGASRRCFLGGASYYFYYTLSHSYVVILLFVSAMTYYGGLALRSRLFARRRELIFTGVIAAVLLPLLIFKYAAFLTEAISGLISFTHPVEAHELSWALPVGISFFTFAALGYLIDVYLEVIEPDSDPIRLGLFLAFFPLVTAGPIERGGRLIPQLDCTKAFSAKGALEAFRLFFWGLVLKLLFADKLAGQINLFFESPGSTGSLEKLYAMVQYVFYLYSDFAGYSLIAIGSARLLGFEVLQNFQQPFLSTTVPEFWRSWHISLSSWVRDYLFSPLRTHWRRYKNLGMGAALILSFLILGFWHGAAWGFLAFGLFHGLLVTISTFTLPARNRFWTKNGHKIYFWVHTGRVVATFCVVTLTFVVFRAGSIHDALVIYRGLFSKAIFHDVKQQIGCVLFDFIPKPDFHFIADPRKWALIALIVIGDILVRNRRALSVYPLVVQFVAYNAGTALILYTWLSGNVAEPFLYYKF